jgi:hypothetical protein
MALSGKIAWGLFLPLSPITYVLPYLQKLDIVDSSAAVPYLRIYPAYHLYVVFLPVTLPLLFFNSWI